jgi:hypothetical protein
LSDGTTVQMPDFDLSEHDELLGFFCGARCLTTFIARRIAPGAAGEA